MAMQSAAARRWLGELSPQFIEQQWRRGEIGAAAPIPTLDSLFQQRLIDSMHDAVIFVDAHRQVLRWNEGAERLTGLSGSGILSRNFIPSLIGMSDERQRPIADKDCPLAQAAGGGVQWMRRLPGNGRGGRIVAVDAQAVPVVDSDGVVVGVSLLMHDVSEEITLEERCQNLHDMATRDPLTQVANRAEFDRVQAEFVRAHRETKRPCALIMTDIDRFKTINDSYGHQAGDEVIKAIAHLMQTFCRSSCDLVARYGGEEFVLMSGSMTDTLTAERPHDDALEAGPGPQPRYTPWLASGRRRPRGGSRSWSW